MSVLLSPTPITVGRSAAHRGVGGSAQRNDLPEAAEFARQSRILWRERTRGAPSQFYLRELTGPSWYHRIDGPVYSVGGALAEFLLRKYGTERFLRLYFACRPGHFEAECEAHLGVGLDKLESDFWEEVDRLAGNRAQDNQQ